MSDRDFWIMVRRALMMIIRAIELKYIDPPTGAIVAPPERTVTN